MTSVELSRYRVIGQLATGGMGVVYLARRAAPSGFGRVVVVKLARCSSDELQQLLLDEARTASYIHHVNVVPILDLIPPSEGGPALVLDYVPGVSLWTAQQAVSRLNQAIPPAIAASIVRDVLCGLHAAHNTRDEHGSLLEIVHRDVSPQNILIGADGVSRLIDFGVAKAVGKIVRTETGEIRGKIPYMAPEQLDGRTDARSDLFSASVVLWESLVGQSLFRGTTEAETIANVRACTVAAPSARSDTLTSQYDDIVLRGLARTPEERFVSCLEMAEALARRGAIAKVTEVSDWIRVVGKKELERQSRLLAQPRANTRDALKPWRVPIISATPHRSALVVLTLLSGLAVGGFRLSLSRSESVPKALSPSPVASPAESLSTAASSAAYANERMNGSSAADATAPSAPTATTQPTRTSVPRGKRPQSVPPPPLPPVPKATELPDHL